MTEDFLHYLWRQQYFHSPLQCTRGQSIEVLRRGHHNQHAGPDFKEARLRIGTQLWAGHVEVHIRASDWERHAHHLDPAYDNVILHVVYEDDKEVRNTQGQVLPTLCLSGFFDEYLYWRYEQLIGQQTPIACAHHFAQVEEVHRSAVLERALYARLMRKGELIKRLLQHNKGDWESSFYQFLAYGFGLRINAEPMLWLAQSIPLSLLMRLAGQTQQLEALFLGQAGLLSAERDAYTAALKAEYEYLAGLHRLCPVEAVVWNYGKLRPPAFPDLRIAQFAAALSHNSKLFDQFIRSESFRIGDFIQQCEASDYWKSHYRLGRPSKAHKAHPGPAFADQLSLNVTVPFLYIYGMHQASSRFEQRAVQELLQRSAEDNHTTRLFEQFGYKAATAFETQAILELKANFCDLKKCLNCGIGNHLLQRQL